MKRLCVDSEAVDITVKIRLMHYCNTFRIFPYFSMIELAKNDFLQRLVLWGRKLMNEKKLCNINVDLRRFGYSVLSVFTHIQINNLACF